MKKIRDALLDLEEAFKDYKRDNRGEFAKRLAFLTGIWIDPADMTTDIADVVKLIQAEQPFGRPGQPDMTGSSEQASDHAVVFIDLFF